MKNYFQVREHFGQARMTLILALAKQDEHFKVSKIYSDGDSETPHTEWITVELKDSEKEYFSINCYHFDDPDGFWIDGDTPAGSYIREFIEDCGLHIMES